MGKLQFTQWMMTNAQTLLHLKTDSTADLTASLRLIYPQKILNSKPTISLETTRLFMLQQMFLF